MTQRKRRMAGGVIKKRESSQEWMDVEMNIRYEYSV